MRHHLRWGLNVLAHRRGEMFVILLATLLLDLTGCGERRSYQYTTISGSVSLDNKPVQNGTITFFPTEPGHGSGGHAPIVGGEYRLTDVPLGGNAFTFSASVETGGFVKGLTGDKIPEVINPVPERYRTEGVVREIADGGTQDFVLEK